VILPKNAAHFARYLRGIFDNRENTSQIEMNIGARGIQVEARAST